MVFPCGCNLIVSHVQMHYLEMRITLVLCFFHIINRKDFFFFFFKFSERDSDSFLASINQAYQRQLNILYG